LEETGLSASIGVELWERRFDITYESLGAVHQVERYFLVVLDSVAPQVFNSTPEEDILEHRWWHQKDLAGSDAVIYPEEFAERFAGIGGAGDDADDAARR